MVATEQFVLVVPLAYTGARAEGYTYRAPAEAQPGRIVEVTLGRRRSLGVVTQVVAQPTFATKPVERVLDLPPLSAHILKLAEWMSSYYLASPASVWQTILPAGLGKTRRPLRKAAAGLDMAEQNQPLTTDQQTACEYINSATHSTVLLQGVTGSGKTRVYLELARQTLAAGRSVILLVPEIVLAPQLVGVFTATFGDTVITTHSQLTEAQRAAAWQEALASPTPRVVIGPRSALFLPVGQPGLIIIDESHESTYKQEQNPRYVADTVAAKLSGLVGAKLILGSATPNLWQHYLADSRRIGLARLPQKVHRQETPQTQIIDLRDQDQLRQSKLFSTVLIETLAATLAAGRQSLLFLNRRGSASSHLCGDCGRVSICPACALPLTFHADVMRLICHTCNFRTPVPAVCALHQGGCGSANLKLIGMGTKRVETEAARLFPHARLARLDRDSATPDYLHQVHRQLQAGELDILIGTQLVAKGLDIAALDTVGIVSADTMLHVPDYTASERTFQLIAQVSGRAGRRGEASTVIIQSYTPNHPAIVAGAAADYAKFSATELPQRQLLHYPPYVFLLKLSGTRANQAAIQAEATELAERLRRQSQLEVLGPAPSFHEQEGGKWRWQVIVKARRRPDLVAAAQLAPETWTVDLDPINLL